MTTRKRAAPPPDLGSLIDAKGGTSVVAALMGKNESTVWRWRSGAARPSLSNARALGVVLGISTDQVISLTEESAA